jgi:hypothetical protein
MTRDGLKNHLCDDATTVATTIKAGPFKGHGRPRSRLSLGSVKDTLNREERGEEIH